MSHAFSEDAWYSQLMMRHKYTNSHLLPTSPDFLKYFITLRLNPSHPINSIHLDSSFRDLEENQTRPYCSSPSYKSWNTSILSHFFLQLEIFSKLFKSSQTQNLFFLTIFQNRNQSTRMAPKKGTKAFTIIDRETTPFDFQNFQIGPLNKRIFFG